MYNIALRMSMPVTPPKPLLPNNLLNIPAAGGLDMRALCHRQQPLDKVVVVMGATGTGKSRLSIDLATRFPASEIINSDKMQVYKGLDIVTNKITEQESRGVPHHLLGVLDDPNVDFTASDFCHVANSAVNSITSRGKHPIIAGGSNSFIEALIDDRDRKFRSKYQCCFLWVDVSMEELQLFVSERVDRMVERGMIDELKNYFEAKTNNNSCDYSRGIRKSIGVPEFDQYFRGGLTLNEAINKTKINTCKLAWRQREKIIRLWTVKGWKIHRLDATPVFRKRGECEELADKAWEDLVEGPSTRIVSEFLWKDHRRSAIATTLNSRPYHQQQVTAIGDAAWAMAAATR